MNFLKHFAEKDLLLNWYSIKGFDQEHHVNNHIHTPYSFSSFSSMEQIFDMAKEEKIGALGINDFFVTDGYNRFYQLAEENRVFPLFNIEFIGLLKQEQKKGIRVNDPNNPGRTYLSGKGLDYPVTFPTEDRLTMEILRLESQKQVVQMIEKLNQHLKDTGSTIQLNYDEIKHTYAENLVRERHIAKALHSALLGEYPNEEDQKTFLKKLYNGQEVRADLINEAAIENELRSMLLKSGGKAYVPEKGNAFPDVKDIISIIINAGGIPTYPVLLDNDKGEITDFEAYYEALHKRLTSLGIYSVELIPARNSKEKLIEFVQFFESRNFIISFGTEHNTPDLKPLKVRLKHDENLTPELFKTGYEGVCTIAAHQYLRAKGEEGFINSKGKARFKDKKDFILLGKAVLEKYLSG